MTKIRITFYIALLCVAVFGTGRAMTQNNNELREEFHQTYPMTPNGRISLENINGGVQINTWNRNEVKVDAIKRAYTQERLSDAKIEVTADLDRINIKTHYPDRNLNFSDDRDRRSNNPASVEYTVTVPQNARLDSIELINGSLDVKSVKGDVKGSSINGRVAASGLAGDVRLSTINGAVAASFDDLSNVRRISVGSVNGSVELVIPSDTNAEIRASTVHGPITNDFGIPVRKGQYVGRDLSATLGRGGIQIKVDNVNGEIKIHHAADNRPVSPVSNAVQGTENDGEVVEREMARDIAREANRAARDASLAARDAVRAATDAANRDAIRAQVETSQDIQREVQKELQRSQREVQRAAREAADAGREIARSYGPMGNSSNYRLVERDTKNFTVTGTPQVTVQTFDGTVTVRAWDKNEVSCAITKRAGDEDSLRRISVESGQNGNSVSINAKYSKARRTSADEGGLVNLEIYVPKSTNLTVGSGDGRLNVEGVAGELQAKTGDGSVFVTDSSGRLKVETGDGSIRVEGYSGEANVHTGDGRIVLRGKFNQLTAQTGDGSISLELPSDANATIETIGDSVYNDGLGTEETNSSKNIRRWRVGSGGNLLKLHTGDGKIVLRRSAGLK
jgi:hypothetical protein